MENHLPFGRWLQQRRKALDLTQQDLAEHVGCSLSTIRKIETGERRPSRQIAGRLAGPLRIPAEQRAIFIQVARIPTIPEHHAVLFSPPDSQALALPLELNPPCPSDPLPNCDDADRRVPAPSARRWPPWRHRRRPPHLAFGLLALLSGLWLLIARGDSFDPSIAQVQTRAHAATERSKSRISTHADIATLIGSANWFCFPDRQDAIGITQLPEHLVVTYPLLAIKVAHQSFTVDQVATGDGPVTAYLQTILPRNQCPSAQQAALFDWDQHIQPPTRQLIDALVGPGNWSCLDNTNAVQISDVKGALRVRYPFIAVATVQHQYGVGQLVPPGGAATAWITRVLAPSECRNDPVGI